MRLDNGLIQAVYRHMWLVLTFVTCADAAAWWRRAQPRIAKRPELRDEYRRLIRLWLIYVNLPWLVMGTGVLTGAVPSTLHYLNPRNGRFVSIFYLSILAVWIAAFRWLLFRGGAEALAAHPGLLNVPITQPLTVKVLFLFCLAGVIMSLCIMSFVNIRIP